MVVEMLVAMEMADEDGYRRYREAMRPILERYGGGFGDDFLIKEVLRCRAEHPVNRVFTIHFRDAAARDGFFQDPDYLAIREAHFTPSVSALTILASYDRQPN